MFTFQFLNNYLHFTDEETRPGHQVTELLNGGLRTNRCQSAAAAAKSLQSCLSLCDPRDDSPPGFPVSQQVLLGTCFVYSSLYAEKAMAPTPVLLPEKSMDRGAW